MAEGVNNINFKNFQNAIQEAKVSFGGIAGINQSPNIFSGANYQEVTMESFTNALKEYNIKPEDGASVWNTLDHNRDGQITDEEYQRSLQILGADTDSDGKNDTITGKSFLNVVYGDEDGKEVDYSAYFKEGQSEDFSGADAALLSALAGTYGDEEMSEMMQQLEAEEGQDIGQQEGYEEVSEEQAAAELYAQDETATPEEQATAELYDNATEKEIPTTEIKSGDTMWGILQDTYKLTPGSEEWNNKQAELVKENPNFFPTQNPGEMVTGEGFKLV